VKDPKRRSSTAREYAVGYGRPPQHTRFQPSCSGNPKGRPKGSKSLSTLFAEELAQTVTLIENGKRKKMSKRQALVKQAINKALSNDAKAAALVFDEIRRCEGLAPVQQVKMNREEFEAIARKLLDEI
jgi:hypothetical protein